MNAGSRRCSAFAATAFVVLVCAAISAPLLAGDRVDITADRLEVKRAEKRASFAGHVRATYGDIVLECSALDVRYDEAGKVSSLAAKGPVSVHSGDARATAKRAVLDPVKGVLVLEGEPQVSSGPNRLAGTRITVHLQTGLLEVEQAVGAFELPLGHANRP